MNSYNPGGGLACVFFPNSKTFNPGLMSIKIGFPHMPLDTGHNVGQLTSMLNL